MIAQCNYLLKEQTRRKQTLLILLIVKPIKNKVPKIKIRKLEIRHIVPQSNQLKLKINNRLNNLTIFNKTTISLK